MDGFYFGDCGCNAVRIVDGSSDAVRYVVRHCVRHGCGYAVRIVDGCSDAVGELDGICNAIHVTLGHSG